MLMPRIKGALTAGTQAIIDASVEILELRHPISLRGLFYQLVVTGHFSNDRTNYQKLSRAMVKARETGAVDWDWITDSIRQTLKPSSWSGLDDYLECVQDSYRRSMWSRMPHYVCVFCEKDAMAGALEPATAGFDVALHVVRGYVSASFSHGIARHWKRIQKPIFAYYLGDWDPSGLDLERNLRDALERYSGRSDLARIYAEYDMIDVESACADDADESSFIWRRLSVNADDFDKFKIVPMLAKKTDSRSKAFAQKHGHQCAELDAIPADVLRDRVEQAIEGHVDHAEWSRMRKVEQAERDTLETVIAAMRGEADENRD
jgi:hypothetical protein